MAQKSTLDAADRSMLNKSLKLVEEMKGMICDYRLQDEVLSQQEVVLRNQLKDLDFRRKQIKETIEESQATLSRMESTVQRVKCMLSPMRRMPSDILLHIFRECVLLEKDYLWTMMELWEPIESLSAPITLGGVCSHWRTIVKQNARMWDYILIRRPYRLYGDQGEIESQMRIISHWMNQGLQSKQSVLIDDHDPGAQSVIYSILGYRSPLWKSITIGIPSSNSFNGRWRVAKLRAEEVTIYRNTHNLIEFFLPLLQNASKLTIVGPLPTLGNIPWVLLRSLTIRALAGDQSSIPLPFGIVDLRDLLNVATHLENLELDFGVAWVFSDSQESPIQDVVNHRALKTLSLHIHHLDAGGRPFGLKIEAPTLQHLNILSFDEYRVNYDQPSPERWEGITSVALCKIQEHEVSSIADFLRYLPNIINLEVQGHHVNTLFILMNSFYDGVPPRYTSLPLSRLSNVTISRADIRGTTLLELVTTRLSHIEGKTPGVEAITEVKLWDNDLVTAEEWKLMNTLLEKGRVLNTGPS